MITIRVATPGDAARCAELSETLGYPSGAHDMATRLERILSRDADVVFVAVADGGRVVGWLHGSELEMLEAGRRCEIFGLVIDAEYRRQGIGQQLVSAVERWAAGRGIEVVTVRSNTVRPESHPFYEAQGFTRVKSQHVYRKRVGTLTP